MLVELGTHLADESALLMYGLSAGAAYCAV
jgi:hypothetical protein